MSPELIDSKGSCIDYNNITIKANGWAKCYDSVIRNGCEKEYENLRHYPPERIKTIHGEVTYESPHGRV